VQSNLNSVLWAGTAVEHDAALLQTYNQAKALLDRALRDRNWTAALEQKDTAFRSLPPAVIMDIDETILDNSPFEAQLLAKGAGTFDPILWQNWVAEANAPPLPGALEFTHYAHQHGVTVFYVTNREARHKAAARANLDRAGFPFKKGVETLYCQGERPDWGADKTTRRAEIAAHYRILLLFGDDLGDFMSGANSPSAHRREMSDSNRENWGVRWFIVPNAMYGSWETSLYGPAGDTTEDQRQKLKFETLRRIFTRAGPAAKE
jgi:acid phosphatase